MVNIITDRDGSDRFMRQVPFGSALWNRQMGQFAKRPKTVLDLWQINMCRNFTFRTRDLAKWFMRDYKDENPNLAHIADHPLFYEFLVNECEKARNFVGEYADIV